MSLENYSSSLQFRVHREPWIRDTISLRVAVITTRGASRTIAYPEPLALRELSPDELRRDLPPLLELEPGDAQQLIDELWRVGLRPTAGAGSVGQLAATERHLEDMRTLVFKHQEDLHSALQKARSQGYEDGYSAAACQTPQPPRP